MLDLEERLKEHARQLGFDLVGIAQAEEADDFAAYLAWLEQGNAATMDYLKRHAEARRHPASVLADVRSVVMLGMHYGQGPGRGGVQCLEKRLGPEEMLQELTPRSSTGKVARYAQGADYHKVLWKKLDQLLAWVQVQVPDARGRGVVDTAPLLERGLARRAGLGWFGKNTMLIHKKEGSYFFLAALLLDVELRSDNAFETSHCGTCTACLDACPTDAFAGPYQLDARRCISYLTIEHRGAIDPELREGMGEWLFGCDVCQEVCPWNRTAPQTNEPAFVARSHLENPDPVRWLRMTEQEYRELFGGTALTRAKRSGLRRNAAIVLGNLRDPMALPALREAAGDEDAIVAEAARWAIGRIEGMGEGGRP